MTGDDGARRALPSWAVPLAAWAASRALVMGAALLGALAFGEPTRGVDPSVPGALAVLGGWDTTWYLEIARDGYARDVGQVDEVFTNLAFFPLLPGVMAAASAAALNPFLVAFIVVHVAFLGALWAIHALSRRRMDARRAALAVWAIALAPPAVVASMAYTEALVLLAAGSAALLACRGRYGWAGLVAAPAALARPTGLLVAVLVALIAARGGANGRWRRLALSLVPSALAVGGFLVWMQVARGSALLPFDAQEAWDRGGILTGLVTQLPSDISAAAGYVARFEVTAAWTAVARDLAFGVLYVALLVRLWRSEGGLRSPWVAYSSLALALPLSTGSIVSIARFGVLAFPLAWAAADWLAADRRRVAPSCVAAIIGILLLVAQTQMRSP